MLGKEQKTKLLKELDAYIRTKEPLIKEVSISLSGVHEQMLVAATDGTYAGDIRPLVRLSISVLAQRGERRERGSAGAVVALVTTSLFQNNKVAKSRTSSRTKQSVWRWLT